MPSPKTHPSAPKPIGSKSSSTGQPITQGRLLDFPDDPIACLQRLHQTHGDVAALEEAGRRIAFVFEAEYNRQVLTDGRVFHSRFFAIPGGRRSSQRRLTSGLLSMNGEKHKAHRRLVMGAFQKRVLDSYHETVRTATEEMLAGWTPGSVIDLGAEMNQLLLRITAGILFGVDRPALAYRIGERIDVWVGLNHAAGMGVFVSSPEISRKYAELIEQARILEGEIQTLIDHRRGGELGDDVLSLLIRAADAGDGVSTEELIGHIAVIFGAAHLTTSHTLTWTLFLLAQHPEWADWVRAEIDRSVNGSVPTPAEIHELPILERVIRESMRLLPASAYSQRVTTEPVDLGPLRLAAGTPVVFSQFISHRRADVFPEPKRFDPSRWETCSPSPYEYLPFGGGARRCIGATMAGQIMRTVLPMITKHCCLRVQSGCDIEARVIGTTFGPRTPLRTEIHPPATPPDARPVTGNINELIDFSSGTSRAATDTDSRRAA